MITDIAKNFAKEKHMGQVRKFQGEPYFNHVEKVSKIIEENKESSHKNELVAAALLHDTLENTNTNEKELKENFGELITSLVKELTTDKKESQSIGKKEYLAEKLSNTGKVSSWGLVIKLADRLDNVSDLHKSEKKFRENYIDETKHILKTLEEKRALTSTQKKLIAKIREKIKEKIC
ncbi:MAG: HD domain-containing protein [Nanoarchaeota archaeon]|nr:HD domain-containing protein [Nanoarchaeota archaeon]